MTATASRQRLRRMDVDFDHAGIGRHLDDIDARIERRRIAFDVDRRLQVGGGRLDGGEQLEIILEPLAAAA